VFGAIRLLDTESGREIARLTGPESTYYFLACFTADGTRLVATSADEKAIYVWDLRAIREQLKGMGLDWEWPEFEPAEPMAKSAKRLTIEVLPGDPAKSVRAPEEKARQTIEQCRRDVEAKPDSAEAYNELAWIYLTAPAALRDVKAAVPLAEKALRLAAGNAFYRNTLGVAYYRNGRYREAVETLLPNLAKQDDKNLAFDLYFLAMSHHRLGELEQARSYLAWANRWTDSQRGIGQEHTAE
jgi:tetratricopeptide (TPR) repeat protein